MQTFLDLFADIMTALSFGSSTSWRDIDDEGRVAICVCFVSAAIGFGIYLYYSSTSGQAR